MSELTMFFKKYPSPSLKPLKNYLLIYQQNTNLRKDKSALVKRPSHILQVYRFLNCNHSIHNWKYKNMHPLAYI